MSKFKTAYSKKTRVLQQSSLPSETKQSFKQECDINHLLLKYQKTGLLDHVSVHKGNYDNLNYVQDYHTSLNQLNEAQETFDSLPSSIRKHFHNDPELFVNFVLDPDNKEELIQMGLSNSSSGESVSKGTFDTDEAEKSESSKET